MLSNNHHACVIGTQNQYIDFVLVLDIENAETGITEKEVQHYTIQEGENLVYTTPPTHKTYAGAKGYISPLWDGTQWTEGATSAEIEVWEVEHPAPVPTAAEVRAKRDKLLNDTDWTQTLDAPISPASREAMRVYRQALRDITEQAGFPADAVFPVEPVMEKATPDPIDNAVDIMIGGADNA